MINISSLVKYFCVFIVSAVFISIAINMLPVNPFDISTYGIALDSALLKHINYFVPLQECLTILGVWVSIVPGLILSRVVCKIANII